jgi:hypothetical protein
MSPDPGRRWVPIPEAQALAHPLDGMNGALFAFYLLALGGLFVRVTSAATAMTLIAGLEPTLADICRILLAVSLGLPLPFLLLGVSRHPATPLASILCLWAAVAVDGLFLSLGLLTKYVFIVAAASAAMAPVFTLYMLLSRRVNVTYRHRLRPDDPMLHGD